MTLRCAIQMDSLETIDPEGDTSLALALEAQKRGAELFIYQPQNLSLDEGVLSARGRAVRLREDSNNFLAHDAPALCELKSQNVILLRQDPPFNAAYVANTHLLEHLKDHALLVNDPAGVRSSPEKLFPLLFPSLMPPTLVSADPNALLNFHKQKGEIILKPLFSGGGEGILRLHSQDENAHALIDLLLAHYRTPLMAQAYLPQIREGDKRIFLINGAPVPVALNRIPQKGEARANMHVGGSVELVPLDDRDRAIAAAIAPLLRRRGLLIAGIDVIGGFLTEINVTSPTGMREIKRLGGPDIAALVWDAIETLLPTKQTTA